MSSGGKRRFEAVLGLARGWGLAVEDVATVLAVESSFNERSVGGLNNEHQGIIQWGAWERRHELPSLMAKMGLDPKADIRSLTFEQQVGLAGMWVNKRAGERGIKIRSIHDVYRVINPGAYSGGGDAFGTKGWEVLRRGGAWHREAVAWLKQKSGMRIEEIRGMEMGAGTVARNPGVGGEKQQTGGSGVVTVATPGVPREKPMARGSQPLGGKSQGAIVIEPFREIAQIAEEVLRRMGKYLSAFQRETILVRGDEIER